MRRRATVARMPRKIRRMLPFRNKIAAIHGDDALLAAPAAICH
jgi:hypothetical protein